MAAIATQQVIHNGLRNLVLKYTIDGPDGDASAKQLLDLNALDSTLGVGGLKFERAQWALTGFSCKLSWDAAPEVDFLEMPSDKEGSIDLSDVGGVVNNGTEQTGDVMFTTTGYVAADSGHFTLWFKKRAQSAAISAIEPDAGALVMGGLAPSVP
jgi:hypothetical protein